MGLLQRMQLLDNYRSVYFDNWFNSPQLLDEMYQHKILGAGTVRLNYWGLPKALVQRKLKKGETVYRRKRHLLCLKWCDKCPVTMLPSIHHTVKAHVKTNYIGNPVIKPVMIHDYNNRMNSLDHSDHMLSTYKTLKSVKWYRKLILHLMNMVVLNAFILNKKYGTQKMSHSSYREYISNYLITTSLENVTCLRKKPTYTYWQYRNKTEWQAFHQEIWASPQFQKKSSPSQM